MADNVLLIQTAFPGDVVLTTPLFRAVRRVRPDAQQTYVPRHLPKKGAASRAWASQRAAAVAPRALCSCALAGRGPCSP